jgi:hypothetical protein
MTSTVAPLPRRAGRRGRWRFDHPPDGVTEATTPRTWPIRVG